MDQLLIVAKMDESQVDQVRGIWAQSDATALPGLVGVRRRSLFAFHGLYLHLIEADQAVRSRIEAVREHPLFREVNDALAAYIAPFDPLTWRGPADAMARRFYSWQSS